jgi:hypothetical protein
MYRRKYIAMQLFSFYNGHSGIGKSSQMNPLLNVLIRDSIVIISQTKIL